MIFRFRDCCVNSFEKICEVVPFFPGIRRDARERGFARDCGPKTS